MGSDEFLIGSMILLENILCVKGVSPNNPINQYPKVFSKIVTSDGFTVIATIVIATILKAKNATFAI